MSPLGGRKYFVKYVNMRKSNLLGCMESTVIYFIYDMKDWQPSVIIMAFQL